VGRDALKQGIISSLLCLRRHRCVRSLPSTLADATRF